MNKEIWLLFISLTVICLSCLNKDPISKYYGIETVNDQTDRLIHPISLDSIKSFKQLESVVCEAQVKNLSPAMIIKGRKVQKYVFLNAECKPRFYHYRLRNVLKIHNDSIKKWFTYYSLDSLKMLLDKDFNNKATDEKYSEAKNKFVVFLSFDDKSLNTFKHSVLELTRALDELELSDSIPIYIKKVPPPPPPPPDSLRKLIKY